MTVVGIGSVVLEYFYDIGINSMITLLILGGIGILGVVLMSLVLREYIRNWYWHEVKKEHAIAFLVLILVIFLALWYYGWIDWLL